MAAITAQTLTSRKQAGQKFACVTAYDATFAAAANSAGIESLLVGDSLGNVLQGHSTTVPVTLEQMAYHVECVSRGNGDALLIGDLPFMAYATLEQTLQSSATLMRAGAQMVKLEGGHWLCDTINALTTRGIPVCGHLGLTPQSVNTLGGFKVQGRDEASAQAILADAKALQAAGASLLVVECVPVHLGASLAAALDIPVIGIGAGPNTDAQVLVLHDLLGLNPRPPRFVRDFMAAADSITGALQLYGECVRDGTFPAPEHCFQE